MKGPIIGIDLGTTHSLVAVMTPEGPQVLADEEGRVLLPSAVAVDDEGHLLVGVAAEARLGHDPAAGARWFKRDMGQDVELPVGGERLSPPALSALVLRELRTIAELALGQGVERAVITVPAYFQEPQRAATAEAARLAGLELVRMVNEPTAAALAWGRHDTETERRIAVLDLGGGTFDVTVLEVFEGIIEVVASGGDGRLGGEDWTQALYELACQEAGLGERDPAGPRALLHAACERAKRELADRPQARISLPAPGEARWRTLRTLQVTRPVFEAATRPLQDRLRRCILDTLASARIAPRDVDEVLLVGGASRMPAFRALAEEIFGRPPLGEGQRDAPDPDLLVALGAAVQAALVDRDAAVADLVVTDVLSHSLGVEVAKEGEDRVLDGYFLPVLHRNTTLPVRRVERLWTMHHAQTRIKVQVYQGEHRYTQRNRLLGSFTVQGIPKAESEEARQAVDIAFTHDLNGLLEVEATVVETGEKASILIEQQAGRLGPEALARARRSLERLKIHPRELLPNRTLLELAIERLARLEGSPRAALDGALTAFEDALARQQPEAIDDAGQTLRELLAHPALAPLPEEP